HTEHVSGSKRAQHNFLPIVRSRFYHARAPGNQNVKSVRGVPMFDNQIAEIVLLFLKQGTDFLKMLVGQEPKEIRTSQQIDILSLHSLGRRKNFQSMYLLSNSLKQRSIIRFSSRARTVASCRDGSVRVFTRHTSKPSPRGIGSKSVPAFTLRNFCCCSDGTSSSKTSLL